MQRHEVLLALAVLALVVILSLTLKPKAPQTRARLVSANANGYDLSVLPFTILDGRFVFKYTINDSGTLQHSVQTKFGLQSHDQPPGNCPTHANYDSSFHVLREIGPNAQVYDAWGYAKNSASEISQYLNKDAANSCFNMIFGGKTTLCSGGTNVGGGFVDTPSDPKYLSSTITKYICYANETNNRGTHFVAQAHLYSMTIIATTSVHDDQRVWNLVSTYLGLGLLAQVRGSIITEENFLSGYTPLFDDMDTPDCGQRTYYPTVANAPVQGDPDFPGPGFLGFNHPNDSYSKKCGKACSVVLPYNQTAPVIWEMASTNGRYRLQFFDSGHVSFIDTAKLVPIYSTIPKPFPTAAHTDFPLCVKQEFSETDVGVYLDKVRDAWVIRGASYKYLTPDGNLFLAPYVDLMVQITNYGALVLQKDYVYGQLKTTNVSGALGLYQRGGTSTEDVGTSHLVVQSALPLSATPEQCTLANFTIQQNTVVPVANGAGIGVPSQNDTNNYQMHYSLGNVLVCQGFKEMAIYDWNNGTTLAYSNLLNGHRYFLWLGPFGLRLLRLPSSVTLPQPEDLEDWSACQWITKPYNEWFYSHDKNSPPQRISLMTAFKNCVGGANVPSCSLQTCGTFLSPVATANDSVILTLRSPNKRYVFYMLSSGVCRLEGETLLYSTENYTFSDSCDQQSGSC